MKKGIIVGVIIVAVFGALYAIPRFGGSTELNGFAQCLSDSGSKFYGAWWCPHCQEQKKMFSKSADLLPYVECSGSNPNGPQAQECVDAGIEGYPTWVFPDGSRMSGEVPLATLAEKTGCVLPTSTQ